MSPRPDGHERFRDRGRDLLRRFGFTLERYPLPGSLDARLGELTRAKQVNLVLDVGANRGQYASRLRDDVGYDGWIVSFEPSIEDFEILERRMAGDKRWAGRRYALSDREASGTLHIYDESQFSSLEPPSQHGLARWPTLRSGREEVTTLRRLDAVFEDLLAATGVSEPRILLKTDTQGHDLHVLRGAPTVLRNVEILQAELALERSYEGAPAFAEMLTTLSAMNFSVAGLFPIAWSQDGQRIMECDCLLVSAPSGGPGLNPLQPRG